MAGSPLTPEDYLSLGWAVVPIDREQKTPVHADWPRRAAARDFTPADFEGRNVGVVLGHVSGDLVDVDLDSAAAVELAPAFLPDTLTFGRASKPASHWLYKAPGLTSEKLWFENGDGRELVEIRAANTDGVGCGHQTVFPGSVHPSGEAIVFDCDQPPTEISAADLRWAVARLAVASAILNGWGEGSGRHEKSLGLAGGLLKAGWTAEEVRHCLHAVRIACGDSAEEEKDFGHDVETTIKKHAAGEDVQGFGTLVQGNVISEALAKDLERHAMTPERRARAAKALATGSPGQMARAGVNDVAAIRELVAGAGAGAAPAATAYSGDILGRRIDLAVEPEPLSYLFEGLPLAPGGKVNSIAGAPNAGKSPFAQLLLFSHVTGLAVAGVTPLRKGWGLYQDAETGLLAHIRWRRICRAYGVDPATIEGVDFRDVDAMFSEPYCQALQAYCAERGPNGFVVIDTYGAMLAADIDNNSPQFAHWLRQLGLLSRRLSVVIVVLVHNNKSAKGGGIEGIAGNYQGAGAMQSVVMLERTGEGNDAPILVRCARAPEHTFAPFRLKWQDVKSTPGQDLKNGTGLRADRVEAEDQAEAPAQFSDLKKRATVAWSIIDSVTRTPHQAMTTIVKQARGGREAYVRDVFRELVDLGVLLEITTSERVNNHGQVEPVLAYDVAEGQAGAEARLKAGLVR